MQLYSAKEKQLLSDVVYTMVSFNLTYRQDRNSEGQYAYHLEPYVASACVISVLVFVGVTNTAYLCACVCVCISMCGLHVNVPMYFFMCIDSQIPVQYIDMCSLHCTCY